MTPPTRLILLVVGALVAGGASGAGVGLGLYPPAVAVGLAVAIGLAAGWFVRRTILAMRRGRVSPGRDHSRIPRRAVQEDIMGTVDPLLAPMAGADHREVGGVQLDIVRTGAGRVKRVIYPPGFRWSEHMKGVAGTEVCMHAHVGFLARGHVQIRYADGCALDFVAPQVMAIEPGHEGWVVGDEAAVLIEVDFEGDTASRFGLPSEHRHD